MSEQRIIGFAANAEEVFQHMVIEEINRRKEDGIVAEYCKIGEVVVGRPSRYKVIIDRLSHFLAYYKEYLKTVSMQGTIVINNPFRYVEDKFLSYSLAQRLGVAVPKTVALPAKEWNAPYWGGEVTLDPGDLDNLKYPLDWEAIVEYIGFPAILKPCASGGWRDVYTVYNLKELMYYYEHTGYKVMMLQEYINPDHFVRCLVFGKKHVLPIRYDIETRSYLVDHKHLNPDMGERIVTDCIKLNTALDYDMNSVEFAIRDGIPYAIDFVNIVPDARPEHIHQVYFNWMVDKLATVAIEYARSDKTSTYWDHNIDTIRGYLHEADTLDIPGKNHVIPAKWPSTDRQ
jgi:hypothetical protein